MKIHKIIMWPAHTRESSTSLEIGRIPSLGIIGLQVTRRFLENTGWWSQFLLGFNRLNNIICYAYIQSNKSYDFFDLYLMVNTNESIRLSHPLELIPVIFGCKKIGNIMLCTAVPWAARFRDFDQTFTSERQFKPLVIHSFPHLSAKSCLYHKW